MAGKTVSPAGARRTVKNGRDGRAVEVGRPMPESRGAAPVYQSDLVALYQTDCFDWLRDRAQDSIHAVVTDPPYGLIEYEESHLQKLESGHGGVWRIPPKLGGYQRAPLPRFTVQTAEELKAMTDFFTEWATLVFRVLVPGGHVLIATNPLLSNRLYNAILGAGFESRGEFIRLVTTLRGGDRPKNAHHEFDDVTVMPKSNFEPWGIFRKPIAYKTVAENLRVWHAGGFRRIGKEAPFGDVFRCPPASPREKKLAGHPTLKPQRLMRHLVRSVLPLGKGVVLDTFAGSGSTLAAAQAVGYHAIGLERRRDYVDLAAIAIPRLAAYTPPEPNGNGKNGKRHAREEAEETEADRQIRLEF